MTRTQEKTSYSSACIRVMPEVGKFTVDYGEGRGFKKAFSVTEKKEESSQEQQQGKE